MFDATNERNERRIRDESPFQEQKSIVDTMSGDPIKAVFESKELRTSKQRGTNQPNQNQKSQSTKSFKIV